LYPIPTDEDDDEVAGAEGVVVVLVGVGVVVGLLVVVLDDGALVGVVLVEELFADVGGWLEEDDSAPEASDVGVGVPGCGVGLVAPDVVTVPPPGFVPPAAFRSARCRSRSAAAA
jgi:hypothetical protein